MTDSEVLFHDYKVRALDAADAHRPGRTVELSRIAELHRQAMDEAARLRAAETADNSNVVQEARSTHASASRAIQMLASLHHQARGGLRDHEAGGSRLDNIGIRICAVCLSEGWNVELRPCDHRSVCEECTRTIRIRGDGCPICGERVTGMVVFVEPAPAPPLGDESFSTALHEACIKKPTRLLPT